MSDDNNQRKIIREELYRANTTFGERLAHKAIKWFITAAIIFVVVLIVANHGR